MKTEDDVIEDCRKWIAQARGARDWNETRQAWLARAARRLGITQGRAVSLFYRKARGITAVEYLALQARVEALETAAKRRRENLYALERARMDLGRGTDGSCQQMGYAEGREPAQGRLF